MQRTTVTADFLKKRNKALLEVLAALKHALEEDLGLEPSDLATLQVIAGLRRDHVGFCRTPEQLKIRIGSKSRKPRISHLELEGESSQALLAHLAELSRQPPNAPLWPSRRGAALSLNGLQRIVIKNRPTQ